MKACTPDPPQGACKLRRRLFLRVLAVGPLIVLLASCSTYRSLQADDLDTFLATLEKDTLAELMQEHPEAQADMDRAVGYAIFANTVTKVPMVGAGDGIGLVVDTETGERTAMRAERLDVGGGLGTRTYRLVIFLLDRETLLDLADGEIVYNAGAEAGAGHEGLDTGSRDGAYRRKDDHVTYLLVDQGASATWTVRAIRFSVIDQQE